LAEMAHLRIEDSKFNLPVREDAQASGCTAQNTGPTNKDQKYEHEFQFH